MNAHEEGRRQGLAQAAAHLRGEAHRLGALQRRVWDLHRDKLIKRLRHLASVVETLK